ARDRCRPPDRDGAALLEHRAQRLAFQELEGDEGLLAIGVSEVEQLDDVGVTELLDERGLTLEALRVGLRAAEVLEEDLERHRRAGIELGGAIDGAETALSDDSVDPIAAAHLAGAEPRFRPSSHAR